MSRIESRSNEPVRIARGAAGRLARLIVGLAAAGALAALPASAAITTVFTCPSSGSNGNHDGIYNGFRVQNVVANNLHSAQLYYTTDTPGLYNVTLEVHSGSYGGPLVSSVTQNMSLSTSSDTAVTWTFSDAAITSGSTLFFVHSASGPGGVQFNLQPTICPGDIENVGTSNVDNGFSVAVTLTTNSSPPPPPPPTCVANATTLCIDNQPGDRRFQARVTFSTTQGGGISGSGHAVPLSSLGVNQGGLFWFFNSTNPEMLLKVLNACGTNNRFWVFYAATTNVGFHVTVTDTATGHVVNYDNADIHAAAPVQDTGAFTCP